MLLPYKQPPLPKRLLVAWDPRASGLGFALVKARGASQMANKEPVSSQRSHARDRVEPRARHRHLTPVKN
eukprot:8971227-Pyramimonas_sp.AAC.2